MSFSKKSVNTLKLSTDMSILLITGKPADDETAHYKMLFFDEKYVLFSSNSVS